VSLRTTGAPDPLRLKEVARLFGAAVDEDEVEALVRFGALFLQWNARINLSGVRTADELVERHFADAFAAARFVVTGSRVVDVGSGGGLPIIPMALLRVTCEFDLFEPRAKKVAFLRTSVRVLGISDRVRIHPCRLDARSVPEFSGKFDLACSRATLPVAEWLALGQTLVRPGGRILVFATEAGSRDLPTPGDSVSYSADRRLLVFTSA